MISRFTFLTSVGLLVLAASAPAELIYGATVAGSLVSFDSASPGNLTTVGSFSGLVPGQTLRAIDFRPATGVLYALSSDASSSGQLYTVNLTNASLTPVGSSFALASGSSRVSMDFNPVADRIRVITGVDAIGGGTNLRLNPVGGTVAGNDTAIAYDGSQPAPQRPNISGIGYTNNVPGATSTTLYGYDFANNRLVTIGSVGGSPISPNSGRLFDVGGSGIFGNSSSCGFDISGATGVAYYQSDSAPSGLDSLFSVNLATGAATSLGAFGVNMLDISVAIAPVPEPGTLAVFGLGAIIALRRRKRA